MLVVAAVSFARAAINTAPVGVLRLENVKTTLPSPFTRLSNLVIATAVSRRLRWACALES